jgi:hypothetical protein
MIKVTEFKKKVKVQVNNPTLTKAIWVVGIDICKKDLLCSYEKRPNSFVPF